MTPLSETIKDLREKLADCEKRQEDLKAIQKELTRQIRMLTTVDKKASAILNEPTSADTLKEITDNLK